MGIVAILWECWSFLFWPPVTWAMNHSSSADHTGNSAWSRAHLLCNCWLTWVHQVPTSQGPAVLHCAVNHDLDLTLLASSDLSNEQLSKERPCWCQWIPHRLLSLQLVASFPLSNAPSVCPTQMHFLSHSTALLLDLSVVASSDPGMEQLCNGRPSGCQWMPQ